MGNLALFYKLYQWYSKFAAIISGEVSQPPANPRDVQTIQLLLLRNGILITPDGQMGETTTRAIKDFQANRALDADGLVGSKTWAALVEGAKL
jgi:peptidoglycan hydrolase-like protein with peptidoglycan-binding domain